MPETTLDRMGRKSVEEALNAMPASATIAIFAIIARTLMALPPRFLIEKRQCTR